MMAKVEVFEPAMCCSTGVCGVDVDPVLVRFAADVQALAQAGVDVVRHRLGHDTAAFAASPQVILEMQAGMDRLPIVTVDGRVVTTGSYPTKAQLLAQLGPAVAAVAAVPAAPARAGGCGCGGGTCS